MSEDQSQIDVISVRDIKPVDKEEIELYEAFTALPESKEGNEISITSFNTQYKAWCGDDDYPYVSNDEWRKWEYRLPRLRSMIECFKSDIICLQEIDKNDFKSDFGDYFENIGYTWMVNTTKKNKIAMANAFLFRTNKFNCIWSEYRSRAMIMLLELKNDFISKCQNCCQIDSRNEKKSLCSCNCIFIVNVHLQAGPECAPTRYSQINSIFKSIEKKINQITNEYPILKNNKNNSSWMNKFEKMNIIICGDFNSGINEETEKYLLTNQIEPSWTFGKNENITKMTDKLLKHDWCFYEAYRHLNKKFEFNKNDKLRHTLFPTFAAYNAVGCLDFFYYSQLTMKCMGVSHTLPLHRMKENLNKMKNDLINKNNENENENKKEEKEKGKESENILQRMLDDCWFEENGQTHWLRLPDGELVSDHLPISAVFRLNQCNDYNQNIMQCCLPQVSKSTKKKQTKVKPKQNKKNKSKENFKRQDKQQTNQYSCFHEIFTF